ncbi:hypothetical protein U1Q18_029500 [Sarracenia purpurea var. burkii]
MASSPSSCTSKPLFLSRRLSLVLFLILPLISSCVATRPGGMMMPDGGSKEPECFDHFRQLIGADYRRRYGMVFNVLPKGTPIPPSGPSDRHNSVVNSSPKN